MSQPTAAATRFYAVVVNYDATYHRREIVEAASIDAACNRAIEEANQCSDWASYDDVGPTYVAAVVAANTLEDAQACACYPADLVSAPIPFELSAPSEQIATLQGQLLEETEQLQRARKVTATILAALLDAEAFMAEFEGDEVQVGLAAKLRAVREAIHLAEASANSAG